MTSVLPLRILDSRRLTGLNIVSPLPSALVDVAVDDMTLTEALVSRWKTIVADCCAALDWPSPDCRHHHVEGGVCLTLAAPIDRLYAAVEIAEWACANAIAMLLGLADDAEPRDSALLRLRAMIDDARDPRLLELAAEAAGHGVMLLWDDDDVSVGLGRGAQCWPARSLPAEVDWSAVHDVPVALVTGTNGKTTTVRLASRILRAAGLSVGISSTDAIIVNDRLIDRGDYSGPGGARQVLRDREVDVAVLETARGGLLRRGLGVARADAALITNISEDHLGDFGSRNLAELADLKWLVMRALTSDATAVLNADDALLVSRADGLNTRIIWFSMDVDHPLLAQQARDGGTAFSVADGMLVRCHGDTRHALVAVADIPVTLGGVARHNTANALAAAALATALGAHDTAIVAGLTAMQANDNVGRCNLFEVDGVDVLVDFAHNPQAMAALFDIASVHPARRRVLCFGQAGDRTDSQIRDLARGAWAIGLERVIVSELAQYYRGRQQGEVFALIRDTLIGCGADDGQISHHQSEAESLAEALDWAQPGDLVIMLALADAENLLHTLRLMSAG